MKVVEAYVCEKCGKLYRIRTACRKHEMHCQGKIKYLCDSCVYSQYMTHIKFAKIDPRKNSVCVATNRVRILVSNERRFARLKAINVDVKFRQTKCEHYVQRTKEMRNE